MSKPKTNSGAVPRISLLACPFCGKSALETDEITRDHGGGFQHKYGLHIRCESCGARGPHIKPPCNDAAIIGAWNRRKANTMLSVSGEQKGTNARHT